MEMKAYTCVVAPVYAGSSATRLCRGSQKREPPRLVIFDPSSNQPWDEHLLPSARGLSDILSLDPHREDVAVNPVGDWNAAGPTGGGFTIERYAEGKLYGTFSQIAHNAFERVGLDGGSLSRTDASAPSAAFFLHERLPIPFR
ncbi:hypothetical protein GCM10018952_29320 [Streptosporangium vulgare]